MKKFVVFLACLFLSSGTAYAGLVAHWSFNNEADVGFDESGNGNVAIPNGSISWVKGSLFFDGDDYLDASISPPLLSQYTVCLRFKSTSALSKDLTYLITRAEHTDPDVQTDTDNFFLRWLGSGRMCGGHTTADGEEKVNTENPGVDPGAKINNGKWHELWLTYDGTKLRIYRDGILDASKNIGPPDASGSVAPVRIGARNTAAQPEHWFKGYVDDVKIYDEALTPPTIELISAYVDYGFGGNMNHFYPRDLMRFNIDYVIQGGDPKAQYRVVAVALNKYPLARGCARKKKINKGFDIVRPGAHTLRYSKEVPACAEPPALEWADCVDVNWTLKLTTKLTKEDRQVILYRDSWLMDEALFVHSEDNIYKGM